MIFEGSTAVLDERQSTGPDLTRLREWLRSDRILGESGGLLVFQGDYVFNSPNTAAGIIAGGNTNGWKKWLDKNGRTLADVYRSEREEA